MSQLLQDLVVENIKFERRKIAAIVAEIDELCRISGKTRQEVLNLVVKRLLEH